MSNPHFILNQRYVGSQTFHLAQLPEEGIAASKSVEDDPREKKNEHMIEMAVRRRSRSPVSPLQIDTLSADSLSFRSSSFSSNSSSSEGGAPTQSSCNSCHIISDPGAASSIHRYGVQQECPAFESCQDPITPASLHMQNHLRAHMKRAERLQQAIGKSDSNLRAISSRLPPLVVALAPLYSDCKDAKNVGDFIHHATGPALAVLESFGKVRDLVPAIECGPVNGNDTLYLQHISSLENALAFLRGNSSRVLQRLHGVVETLGSNKVVDQLSFHRWKEILAMLRQCQASHDPMKFGEELYEGAMRYLETRLGSMLADDKMVIQMSESLSSATESEFTPPWFSSLGVLQAVVRKLSSQGRLQNCLQIYEKARAFAVQASLQTNPPGSLDYLQLCTPEAVNKMEWESLEVHIATWAKQMKAVVKVLLRWELHLIRQVFRQAEEDLGQVCWGMCFGRLSMNAALQHWLRFGKAVARSQGEPQKLFKLLEMFETVEILRPSLDEILGRRGCEPVRRQVYEMQNEVAKGACRVFRAFATQSNGDWDCRAPADGGVLKLTSYVVNYVKCLLNKSYEPIMTDILRREQQARGAEKGASPQLKVAILQLMQATERAVEYRARELQCPNPALGQIFLMNNHWYVYSRSKNSELAKLLGSEWHQKHKQRAEKCALRYQREAWGQLLANLNDGVRNSSEGVLRQRVEEFEAAFLDICRRHRGTSVPDDVLRQQLGCSVIRAVVPPLTALLRRFASVYPNLNSHREIPPKVISVLSAVFSLPTTTRPAD